MYAVVITNEGGVQRRLDFTKPEVTVGRVQGNDIVLSKRNVSKQHARLTLKDEQPVVVDLNSTNGTWVNGRKITSPHALKQGDKIYIADFILTLEPAESDSERQETSPPAGVSEPPPLPPKPPRRSKQSMPRVRSMPARHSLSAEQKTPSLKEALKTSLPPPRIERRVTEEAQLPDKIIAGSPVSDPLGALMSRLAERFDVYDVEPSSMQDQERWSAARAAIAETFLAMQNDGLVNEDVDMRQVAHVALHEAVGLGALDDALSDDSVRAIVVNGPDRVFVDTGKGLEASSLSFSSNAALLTVTERLAAQSGQALEGQLVLHGRLSFGPSVTIMQAPLVVNGPVIEIRISRSLSLEQLAEEDWMSADAAEYLTKAVADKRNIVVVGPRGAGVTTVLSALARELPETANVVVMEAIPDLDIDRERVISLTATDSTIAMADVIEHGARLRADHLVINDLSGPDSLAAFATLLGREPGHLLGVHCWSSKNAIEGLMLAAGCGGASRTCIAQLVGGAVDVVIALERGSEGSRVTAIHEIEGHEAGDVSYQSVPF